MNRKTPQLAGISGKSGGKVSRRWTAWLGREDSNLRMVESKSGYFTNDFNEHSEIIMKFGFSSINTLEPDSE